MILNVEACLPALLFKIDIAVYRHSFTSSFIVYTVELGLGQVLGQSKRKGNECIHYTHADTHAAV